MTAALSFAAMACITFPYSAAESIWKFVFLNKAAISVWP
ncbi:hypothetical protein DO70_5256 [Burkholderia pseudomallei]|nr:hypothetical protein DO70_5256 [Burkholderia pseudomallei]